MTSTLAELRAGAARLCDDWVKFIATQDSADTTVLIDEYAGYENDHHFRGSEVWVPLDVISTANRGRLVRVVDSDRDMASLTFGPGLVSSPVSGDAAWVYNIGGEGTRVRTYDAFINDAIVSLGVAAAPVHSETLPDLWDNTISWADIPILFSHIGEVQYLDANNNYAIVPSYGWQVDDVNKRIAIYPDFADYANGYAVRLNGRKAHPTLVNDTDTTDVDYEWLTMTVAAHILINMNDQLKVNKGGMYMNATTELRGKAGPFPYSEGLVRVR